LKNVTHGADGEEATDEELNTPPNSKVQSFQQNFVGEQIPIVRLKDLLYTSHDIRVIEGRERKRERKRRKIEIAG